MGDFERSDFPRFLRKGCKQTLYKAVVMVYNKNIKKGVLKVKNVVRTYNYKGVWLVTEKEFKNRVNKFIFESIHNGMLLGTVYVANGKEQEELIRILESNDELDFLEWDIEYATNWPRF